MKQYLKELLRRKDLVKYLVVSNLKAQHRNSVLGYLWWMLDPLLSVVVYYFLVVVVLKRGGPGFGPFLVVGLVVFKSFAANNSTAARAIVKQAGIIKQVYLPKAIFPFASSLAQLINFIFGLFVIIIFLIANKVFVGVNIFWLPFILFIHLLFLSSISMIISYYCVFLRDIENFIVHINMVLRYGSPVIWDVDSLPPKFKMLADINPITTFLNSYRNIFLYNSKPETFNLLLIGLVSLVLLSVTLFLYNKTEHRIVKVL